MRSIPYFIALAGAALAAQPATAKQGDVLVRVRAIVVAPTGSSGPVQPGFPGGSFGVSKSVMPEVDFTYMLREHIGAELIVATTRHEARGQGALAGVGTLASTWVLPPTLTLQYHFAPGAKVRPYVGAGINYSVFYNAHASPALETAIGATKVHLGSSVGYALQTGVDIDLSKTVFLNLDVKYVDMRSNVRLTTGAAVNTARANISPIIAGVGLGMRF